MRLCEKVKCIWLGLFIAWMRIVRAGNIVINNIISGCSDSYTLVRIQTPTVYYANV